MLHITRRKRTDEGLPIPDWARRGFITLTQFGLDGPVVSRLDFRVDPRWDGLVQIYFTGQTIDACIFTTTECHDFPLSKGLLQVARLERRSGCPMFDGSHFGVDRLNEGEKLARGLVFSESFQSHESRYIRFYWCLPRPGQRIVDALPMSWWLAWFEGCPDLARPNLKRAGSLTDISPRMHPDTIRNAILEGNPGHPANDWLREVDLAELAAAGLDAESDPRDDEEHDCEAFADGIRLVDVPLDADDSSRFTRSATLDWLKASVEAEKRSLASRLGGLDDYGRILDEVPDRLAAIEQASGDGADAAPLDLQDLLVAVHCVAPAPVGTCGVGTVLQWARTFAGDKPDWWCEWDPESEETAPGDAPLSERLLHHWSILESPLRAEGRPLDAMGEMTWPQFGPAALVWLLGPKPDAELRRLAELDDHGRAAVRLVYELVVIRRRHLERFENQQHFRQAAIQWSAFDGLADLFPAEVRDDVLEGAPQLSFPTLSGMQEEFGVRPTDPAALVLAKSPEISDVFDSRLRPFGFVPEDLDRSRLLWYFVMRSAWQQRPETEPGTGVDPAATDRDAGTGVD